MKYCFFIISIFIIHFSYAQIVITNEKGERIRIKQDGTWEYVDKINTTANVTNNSSEVTKIKSFEEIELEKLQSKAKLLAKTQQDVDKELTIAKRKSHPLYDCMKTQDLDEESGNLVTRTEFKEFFRFTSKLLEKQFPMQDYLIAYSSVGSSVNGVAIGFRFEINSLSAATEYGGLRPKQKIEFTFVDGSKLDLVCVSESKIDYDVEARKTFFEIMIPFNKNDANLLATREISKVKIDWNTGFEDYEIINVDFFKKMMLCL